MFTRWIRWWRAAASVRRLDRLDDRLLADLGLSRDTLRNAVLAAMAEEQHGARPSAPCDALTPCLSRPH